MSISVFISTFLILSTEFQLLIPNKFSIVYSENKQGGICRTFDNECNSYTITLQIINLAPTLSLFDIFVF
jgi:hypothetical protein